MNDLEYIKFAGGGAKGIFYVSALAALKNEGVDHLAMKGSAGTSIGSLFALMTVLGMSLDDMLACSLTMSIDYLITPSTTIFEGFGMMDMVGMKQFLFENVFVPHGLPLSCTFAQLREKCNGKPFVVTVSDMTEHERLLFGMDASTDEEPVIERMLDSMCLPGLFSRRFYKGHWVADGGWYNNLVDSVFPPKKTLVLSFPLMKGPTEEKIRAMPSGQFLVELLLSCHLYVCKEQSRDGKIPHHVVVPDMGFTAVHVWISKEKRLQMVRECYNQICEQRNQLGHLAARCLEIFLKQ